MWGNFLAIMESGAQEQRPGCHFGQSYRIAAERWLVEMKLVSNLLIEREVEFAKRFEANLILCGAVEAG